MSQERTCGRAITTRHTGARFCNVDAFRNGLRVYLAGSLNSRPLKDSRAEKAITRTYEQKATDIYDLIQSITGISRKVIRSEEEAAENTGCEI